MARSLADRTLQLSSELDGAVVQDLNHVLGVLNGPHLDEGVDGQGLPGIRREDLPGLQKRI